MFLLYLTKEKTFPKISGILVFGEKGNAKSTAVRSIANLLPDIDVVKGCKFNCNPDDLSTMCSECIEKMNNRMKNNRDDFRSLAEGRYRLFDAFVENNVIADAAGRVLSLYAAKASISDALMLSMREFFIRAAKFEF